MNHKKVWSNPFYFIAFGFGAGLMPFAPGTFGTLVAIPLYFFMMHLSPLTYALITMVAFIGGVYVCNKVAHEMGVHDHAGIVWDEIVGYLMTMFLVPTGLVWVILGFILFRIFDIWKPQPIRWVDKQIKGGLGIMLDDVLAAVPACMLLNVFACFWKNYHA